MTSSRVKVDLSPVYLLLVEEGWCLDGHEHVNACKAHSKEGNGNHDAYEATWSKVFLDILVAHDLVSIW